MDISSLQQCRCPKCRASLTLREGGMVCSACGDSYPVVHGIPMLLPGLVVRPGRAPTPQFVEEISRLALPGAETQAYDTMRDVFSTDFTFHDRQIGLEGSRFIHRLLSSGFSVSAPYGEADERLAGADSGKPPAPAGGPAGIGISIVTQPDAVRAGSDFWVQARIENNLRETLASGGAMPSVVGAYEVPSFSMKRLFAPDRPPRQTSPLLIDIQAGQAVTQPIPIQASDRIGVHRYKVFLTTAERGGTKIRSRSFKVASVDKAGDDPLDMKWPCHPLSRDYQEDHTHAASILKTWLEHYLEGHRNPVIVELGGNAAPMLALPLFDFLNPQCYNIDVDPFGLSFGTIQRKRGGSRPVQDLLADGNQLPFADGSIHAIVMFATLHHFPDPVRVLKHLRRKLAPGGMICLLCEPVGHVTPDSVPSAFREELADGICEQAFEPWEWQYFFDQANLAVLQLVHDVGSLKVALAAK